MSYIDINSDKLPLGDKLKAKNEPTFQVKRSQIQIILYVKWTHCALLTNEMCFMSQTGMAKNPAASENLKNHTTVKVASGINNT